MKRLLPCLLSVLPLMGLTSARLFGEPDSRPNILFILCDDFGIDSISSYGGDNYQTPEMDKLGTPGLRFEWFYSESVCSPGRAQLLTGQYPFLNGTIGNLETNYPDGYNSPSIAKPLNAAGYATGFIGKDHGTGGDLRADWGFDHYSSLGGGRYWGGGSIYYEGDPYTYEVDGVTFADTDPNDYVPQLQYEAARDWMIAHSNEPFFLYLPLYLPHAAASSPWVYPPTPLTETAHLGLDSATRKDTRGERYKDMIEYIDLIVGWLVQDLKDNGLYENTIIMLAGDNGTLGKGWVDGRRLIAGKASFLNGGSHVPFLVHWPAVITEASVSDIMTDTTDVLPTLVEVAEGQLQPGYVHHGKSLLPLFKGEPYTPKGFTFVQNPYHYYEGDQWYVRNLGYRLNANGELWDMSDARFSYSVIPATTTDPQAVAARQELQAILDEFNPRSGPNYEWHRDKFINYEVPNPYFQFKSDSFKGSFNRRDDSISGDFADPDGDQVVNLVEMDRGTNPTVADAPAFTITMRREEDGTLTARHPALTGNAAEVLVEVTSDLAGWANGAPSTQQTTSGGETVTKDLIGGETRFIRSTLRRTAEPQP